MKVTRGQLIDVDHEAWHGVFASVDTRCCARLHKRQHRKVVDMMLDAFHIVEDHVLVRIVGELRHERV